MSKYLCQRCELREATVTSEAGRFCSECDALNDVEQESTALQEELARLKAENEQLRAIVQEVATAETTYDDDFGDRYCVFCFGEYHPIPSWKVAQPPKIGIEPEDGEYQHTPECIVMKARAIIGQ